MYYYGSMYTPNELYHYGVKGMRWGVRRYQNKDGSLTSAGQRHRDQVEGGGRSRSTGSSGGSTRKSKLRKVGKALGITAAAAATAAASYYGGKKLGQKFLNSQRGQDFLNRALNRRKFNAANNTNNTERLKNRLSSYANRARLKYEDARSAYKNSKLGRGIATEKFKANYLGKKDYAKDLLGRAKNRAVDAGYYVGEKASLYGQKARKGASSLLSNTKRNATNLKNRASIKYNLARTNYYLNGGGKGLASRAKNRAVDAGYYVGEKASLYGQKAKNRAVDAGYYLGEKASLYGQKAKKAVSQAYDRRKRKRMADRATLKRF